MKPQLAIAFIVATAPALAQQAQSTGVSHPPETTTDETPAIAAPVKAKPSAAIPATAPAEQPLPAPAGTTSTPFGDDEFQSYKPYNGAASPTLHSHAAAIAPLADPDASFVTEVPHGPNELLVGTTLRARLRNSIATESTQQNAPFSAELSENVLNNNRVLIPAGSVVEGIVTRVRGGKRFHGAALIHLQAQRVVFPDGTSVPLKAQVTDTDQYRETKTDTEGNIVRKDHAASTLATFSLVTGAAAATGAVLGAGVGAIVGAGIGAGVSTVIWLKQDRQAHLPQDTLLVFSLTDRMDVKPQQPDFVVTPAKPSPSIATAPVPAAPAYAAPQAFVPTN
jgi:hypothetical protein